MTLTVGQARAAGLSVPMGAIPVTTPRRIIGLRRVATGSDLDLLIRSGADRRTLAREMLKIMAKPGRRGVLLGGHLIDATPPGAIAEMLAAWFKAPVPVATWAAMICAAWFGGSSRLADGADGKLREWIERADLMHPPAFLTKWLYSAEELTETVTLYRGGSSSPNCLKLATRGRGGPIRPPPMLRTASAIWWDPRSSHGSNTQDIHSSCDQGR